MHGQAPPWLSSSLLHIFIAHSLHPRSLPSSLPPSLSSHVFNCIPVLHLSQSIPLASCLPRLHPHSSLRSHPLSSSRSSLSSAPLSPPSFQPPSFPLLAPPPTDSQSPSLASLPSLLHLSQTCTQTHTHAAGLWGCCCCYATLLPSVSMWSLRNISYSSGILMSSRTEAMMGQRETTRCLKENRSTCCVCTCALVVTTYMCASKMRVRRTNTSSFVHRTVPLLLSIVSLSHSTSVPLIRTAAAGQWLRQGQTTAHMSFNPNFISYAWYKIQLGHGTAVACILYMVRTIQKHPTRLYKKRK